VTQLTQETNAAYKAAKPLQNQLRQSIHGPQKIPFIYLLQVRREIGGRDWLNGAHKTWLKPCRKKRAGIAPIPMNFMDGADVVARYSLGLIGILESSQGISSARFVEPLFRVLGIVFLAASMKPIARYLESRAWVKKVNTGRLDNQDSVVREHTHRKDTGKIILWFTLERLRLISSCGGCRRSLRCDGRCFGSV